MPKLRRNQEVLDFLENVKGQLDDNRPKSFGLYMKLFKQFGREKMTWALCETLRRKPTDKLRYYLGIFSRLKEDKDVLRQYRKLRSSLVKQMTPPVLRSPGGRTRLHVKMAREERRARRRGPHQA